MNIHKCLDMLSERTIEEIIQEQNRRLNIKCDNSLINRLQDSAFCQTLWDALTEHERQAVSLFYTNAQQGFIRKRDFETITQQDILLTAGLTKLRRLGIIYTVRKMWSEIGYMMPFELRKNLYPLSNQTHKKRIEPSIKEEAIPHVFSYALPAGRGIHMDILAFLLFLREQSVSLTQKNVIPRRMVLKWMERISLRGEHMRGWFSSLLPSEVKVDDQTPVSFLFDLSLRMRLVYLQDKRICLHYAILNDWLHKKNVEQIEEIKANLFRYYAPKESWQEAFLFELQLFDEEWYRVDEILSKLTQIGYKLPEQAQEQLKETWLHPLLGLGMVQLGEDNQQNLWIRHNPYHQEKGDHQPKWYLDSTGEVMVPPGMVLAQLWELSRLGEMNVAGDFISCNLTSRGVQSYLSTGGSVDQILQFLQENTAHPVPDSVAQLIIKWSGEAKQLSFEQVIRFKTASSTLLAELRDIGILAPYISEVISPVAFLIPTSKLDEFVTLLRECGYEPQSGEIRRFQSIGLHLGKDHSNNNQNPLEINTDREGFFPLITPFFDFKVENVFPDVGEAIPGLSTLPKMWTEHYQSYHPNTVRVMLKRAQELRLEVQCQTHRQVEWTGRVQEVALEHGYWQVRMMSKDQSWTEKVDEISRLRILIPAYL
ncbi:hypothetical protein [Brevibacillus laterosporus]|uniref:hypothetical protein n=1 Tax=Brevibacillus laterosporus TaxID=1465 RepID=UPI000E6B99D7|nr:hypothetical protein [Brevibacillus laterosporus]AYB38923.1 hypothetical protein D5F52_11940 [Brevibacillus laterosporus]MBM7109610.1 hypothetical protein [Brevibacillus laterosporus]